MEKNLQKAAKNWVGIIILLLSSVHCTAQGNDIRWLRAIHNPGANAGAMKAISLGSYGIAVAVPAGQLIYGFAANDSVFKRNGWQTFTSLAVTTGITYGIKYAADRARPYESYPGIVPYEFESGHSMPSGHTSISFSTAMSLSLQYKKWYVVAPAFVYAGVVGYTRMYGGAHYPSDVLVGAAVGAGSAWLCHKGQQWLMKSKSKKH